MVEKMLSASKNFKMTTSLDEGLAFSDMVWILVDTPSTGGDRCYDTTKLSKVLSEINKRKVSGKHVNIVCTVFPGYIANIGRFLLSDCPGTTLSYNPEFIAQGDIVNGFFNCDMVLIGEGSKEAGDRIEAIYRKAVNPNAHYCRMSPESSEITKLGVNCFVTTKISFANMVGDICDRTPGADKLAVCLAIGADSRVGRKYIRPGYAFGGPCFPRDNRALGVYAESVGIQPLVSIATDQYNKLHTEKMIADLLAQNKDQYTFTYVAYKDNCEVPIIEESAKLMIAAGLAKKGKKVHIRDIKEIVDAVKAEYGRAFTYEIVPPASQLPK
jgi:UDPglucose 6-dehydrogenase